MVCYKCGFSRVLWQMSSHEIETTRWKSDHRQVHHCSPGFNWCLLYISPRFKVVCTKQYCLFLNFTTLCSYSHHVFCMPPKIAKCTHASRSWIAFLYCAAIQDIGSEEQFHSAMDSADRRNCKSVLEGDSDKHWANSRPMKQQEIQ